MSRREKREPRVRQKTNRTVNGCICPQCGKKFDVISPRSWGYRQGSVYYCSWKCIREFDANIPPHPVQHPEDEVPKVLPEEDVARIRAAVKEQEQRDIANAPIAHRGQPEVTGPKRITRPLSSKQDKINLCLERERLVNEEGMTRAEAARALKVAPSTMDKWIRDYRDELGIQKLSFSECGHRRWERERKADAAEQATNRSGEKIRRIMAAMARIRAALDELNEEVQHYA